jgi:hypothetical protein
MDRGRHFARPGWHGYRTEAHSMSFGRKMGSDVSEPISMKVHF